MSAQEIIEQIKHLPPTERAQVTRFVVGSEDSWKGEARHKIDVGWEQAKSGQLHTPEQSQEILAERKAVWKSSRGG